MRDGVLDQAENVIVSDAVDHALAPSPPSDQPGRMQDLQAGRHGRHLLAFGGGDFRNAEIASGEKLILAALGHRVTAVDGATGMLEQARQNAAAIDVDIRFVQGDVDDPGLPAASCDVVCARNLFWTLPDPDRTLTTIRNLLRPHGTLLLSDGMWRDPADPEGVWDTTYGDVNDALPFYHGIEQADAEALLARNGFGAMQQWHHLFGSHPYPKPTPRRFFVLTASPVSDLPKSQ